MGQYYLALILAEKQSPEIIRFWMNPHNYRTGAKLMAHSYVANDFVQTFETFISPKGMFYKSRVVWAGDYADNEENGANLYFQEPQFDHSLPIMQKIPLVYRYVLNHTKKQYVDKERSDIHPLPLLVCEGNGKGGGDYYGPDEELCGLWSRDIISVNNCVPDDYTELICNFKL